MTQVKTPADPSAPPLKRQSLDQQRAVQAAEDVRQAREHARPDGYRSLVEGLPAMVLANGLGQTCAYLLARAEGKGDSVEVRLYRQLESWLQRQVPRLQGDLVRALMASDVSVYRRAQIETLAYVQWLKRFAQAELPRSQDGR